MRSLVLFAAVCTIYGQQAGSDLRFDVTSVKVVPPGTRVTARSGGGPGTSDPGLMRFPRSSLKSLIMNAYDLDQDLVTGAQWLTTDLFAIEAKVPAGTTKAQAKVMLRNLLHDRFHLVFHMDTRTFPCYELSVAKGGPKMKPAVVPADTKPPEEGTPISTAKDEHGFPILAPWARYQAAFSGGIARASYRISMPEFVKTLSFDLGPILGDPFSQTRVVDKTELNGTFEFALEYQIRPDGDLGYPDIFYALEKQVGLRLQRGERVPLDVLVVDSADRVPVEN